MIRISKSVSIEIAHFLPSHPIARNSRVHGHSLIVDPMGRVLADGGTEPGICYADIDPGETARVRGMLPSLAHTRSFDLLVQSN